MEDRIATVKGFLERIVKKKKNIIPEHSLVEDLGMNSIEFMELIALVEKEYDVIIPVQKLQTVKKVSDLYMIVTNIEQFYL